MSGAPLGAAAVIVAVWLGALTIRRLVLLAASMPAPDRARLPPDSDLPHLTLVVAAHDEADACPGLFAALDRLRYPAGRLSILLVSDGSADATAELFSEWTGARKHAKTIVLERRGGKARALNEALAVVETEVVAVLDADMRPHPDYLGALAGAFADERVGGAAGLILPVAPDLNVVTRYAATEAWVHQLVTSAGKDRLRLNPPTLGASAYRAAAIRRAGGFPLVPYGTDVSTTVALTRGGWRTRFVPHAVAETGVVRSLRDYWSQHVRWSRGSLAAWRRHVGGSGAAAGTDGEAPRRVSYACRVDTWILCAGYLDRVALLGAIVLGAAAVLPLWVPALYLAVPAIEACVALRRASVGFGAPRYLSSLAVMFPVDAAASGAAALIHLARRPARWRSPARSVPAVHADPSSR